MTRAVDRPTAASRVKPQATRTRAPAELAWSLAASSPAYC